MDKTTKEDVRKCCNICHVMGLCHKSAVSAFLLYYDVKKKFTLEGESRVWLAIAVLAVSLSKKPNHLFNASRYKMTAITSYSNNIAFTIPRLFRQIVDDEIDFLGFLSKCKQWAILTDLEKGNFARCIDSLEHEYAVVSLIFRKYVRIFTRIFGNPYEQTIVYSKNSPTSNADDSSSRACNRRTLFRFTWLLYVSVKSRMSDYGRDLVNSYHLLIACCDFVYASYLRSDNPDDSMINRSFAEYAGIDCGGVRVDDYICIVDALCDSHPETADQVKRIKRCQWKARISDYYGRSLLIRGRDSNNSSSGDEVDYVKKNGRMDKFGGTVLDDSVFARNVSVIDSLYEHYLNRKLWCFDERLFLRRSYSEKNFLTFNSNVNNNNNSNDGTTIDSIINIDNSFSNNSLSSCGGGSILAMLGDYRSTSPSESLKQLMSSARLTTLLSEITNLIDRMADAISDQFNQTAAANSNSGSDGDSLIGSYTVACTMALRLAYAKMLYYKWLEAILLDEVRDGKRRITLNGLRALLSNHLFHRALFGCSLEVMIYSLTSQPAFLWIFDVLPVHGFHFYRVIDNVMKVEQRLTDDLIRHLNTIEEYILDCLSWNKASPLWSLLGNAAEVPSCRSVFIREDEEDNREGSGQNRNNLNRDDGNNNRRQNNLNQNQIKDENDSNKDQNANQNDLIHRDRNGDQCGGYRNDDQGGDSGNGDQCGSNRNGDQDGGNRNGDRGGGNQNNDDPDKGETSDRTMKDEKEILTDCMNKEDYDKKVANDSSSLAIFFKKFYQLAYKRVTRLLVELIESHKRRKFIKATWACFQYVVSNHVELMRDRHLDQILICCIYVTANAVMNIRLTFQDILTVYRLQRHAAGHIYRYVLLQNKAIKHEGTTMSENIASCSTVLDMATSADNTPLMEIRGDIIQFYNSTFLGLIIQFLNHIGIYEIGDNEATIHLSPFIPTSMVPSPRTTSYSGLREGRGVHLRASNDFTIDKLLPCNMNHHLPEDKGGGNVDMEEDEEETDEEMEDDEEETDEETEEDEEETNEEMEEDEIEIEEDRRQDDDCDATTSSSTRSPLVDYNRLSNCNVTVDSGIDLEFPISTSAVGLSAGNKRAVDENENNRQGKSEGKSTLPIGRNSGNSRLRSLIKDRLKAVNIQQ